MGRRKLNLENRDCKTCGINKKIEEFSVGDSTSKSCRECRNKKQVEYREKNRDKVRLIKKEWRKKNRKKENKRVREWKSSLTEEQKEDQRIKRNEYLKKKRKEDPQFTMKEAMHRMLNRTLNYKNKSTSELLGYSKKDLQNHIESLFLDGMSWENRGDWHIDHIRPICSFPTGTPPDIINALDNLQPLWWYDNLSKGDNHQSS